MDLTFSRPEGWVRRWCLSGPRLERRFGLFPVLLSDTLGIGFDNVDSTFWIGGRDVLSQVDSSGSVLNQISFAGQQSGIEVLDAPVTPEVPEPSTVVLMAGGLLAFVVFRAKSLAGTDSGAIGNCRHCAASRRRKHLERYPFSAAPQMVGTAITWTVSASDTSGGELWYRYRVSSDGISFRTLSDFGPSNKFTGRKPIPKVDTRSK